MTWRERARDSAAVEAAIRLVDIVLAPVLAVGLLAARLLRVLGIQRTPVARRVIDATGVLPIHDHYYQPLVRPVGGAPGPSSERSLPGIDFGWATQARLVRDLSRYSTEFEVVMDAGDYRPDNGFYGQTDAAVLYALLRHHRPSRVVEVGSGHSTRVAVAALARNADEGVAAHHQCIEPYENRWLESMPVEVVRQPVEALPVTDLACLSAGDVLFIDSSHVIRPHGDVLHLFLQVLPALTAGVLVHVHDVFTPGDYPADWLVRHRRLWNEQYLLETLLSGGDNFAVELAVAGLWERDPTAIRALGGEGGGGAFWIRRTR